MAIQRFYKKIINLKKNNMKKFKKLTTIILLSSILFFTESCEERDIDFKVSTEIKEEYNKIPKIIYNSYVENLKLPDGTRVEQVDDSSIEFIYPKGHELWIYKNNKISKFSSSGYSCTCSGNNGCNVFYVKKNFGCAHGSCTGSCTGKHVPDIQQERNVYYAFVDKTTATIKSITLEKEFSELKYLPSFILKDREIQNKLKNYALSIYGTNYKKVINVIDKTKVEKSSFENIVLVEMKMLGYKFLYGVSINHLKKELQKSNNFKVSYGGHSCNCSSGNSGCKKDSSWGVLYCEGNGCETCIMTIKEK